MTQLPGESTNLPFRHMLEARRLGQQILATVNAKLIDRGLMFNTDTVVHVTLIAAPSSTNNDKDEQDLEMHQTNKGNQWHYCMKVHIGVDAKSSLVHTITTTAAIAHDVTLAHSLLHCEEKFVFADSGFRGVEKLDEIQAQHLDVDWQIAMMSGKRKALDITNLNHALLDKLEKLKAIIRAKVEQPFRLIMCQFGHRKTHYRVLAKKTGQLLVMFALSNLWMLRKRILQGLAGMIAPAARAIPRNLADWAKSIGNRRRIQYRFHKEDVYTLTRAFVGVVQNIPKN